MVTNVERRDPVGWFASRAVFTRDCFSAIRVSRQDHLREAIRQKLGDAVTAPFPLLTRRDAAAPFLAGKARAVIGMRRAGKTSFLHQRLADRLAEGIERDRLVYFNFEDERLGALEVDQLGAIPDEYYRSFPRYRGAVRVTWCLDEIQVIPGWERFVRRMLDSENVEVLLSGSSARMLSREVATAMRGRALETVITPFSFREFARARGEVAPARRRLIGAADQSKWLARFDDYMEVGGFPEASRIAPARERVGLLQGYVDSVLFRDVAERHGVANLVALRALVRQLLRQPAATLSVNKIYSDFRSRGIGVSKENLLAFLAHLEDAFLVFTVPLATRSERQRQVNLRKFYLADHGLAQAFSPTSGLDRGHLLENIVAVELTRQSRDLAYVKTAQGHEVDFLATAFDGSRCLVQVAADISARATFDREVRSLVEAGAAFPDARRILLTENAPPRGATLPDGVERLPVWRWLLDAPGGGEG